MAYLALYRQHRPKALQEVVEQAHIVKTLSNAITENRLSHAYLFAGPRGTGKTTVARILARSLNCEQGPTLHPCGVCASCKSIDQGSSMDVREIDAASNRGIDDIRSIRQTLQYVAESRYKMYIIDEVHMLTDPAFNALLKTLEEPPANTLFVLATTEAHKVPLTILSRCQRYDFRPISTDGIIKQIQKIAKEESFQVSKEALSTLARRAQGGMRDALSLLDQCLSFAGNSIELEDVLTVLGSVDRQTLHSSIQAMLEGDVLQLLRNFDLLEREGKDLVQFLRDLLEQLKEWLSVDSPFPGLRMEQIVDLLNVLAAVEWEMKRSTQPRLILELSMFRAGELYRTGDRMAAMEARIRNLESTISTRNFPLTSEVIATVTSETKVTPQKEKLIKFEATEIVEETQKEMPKVPTPSLEPEKLKQVEQPSTIAVKEEPKPEKLASEINAPLQKIHQKWEDILTQVLREKISAHAILKQGRIHGSDGHRLEVVFQNNFHKKVMEKDDNRQAIERALAAHLGSPILFVPLLANEVSKMSTEVKEPTQEDWLIQAAIELAGQEKVEINPKK